MPADSLLHPHALAAVALLVLNDHVLKQMWPGLVTGKLSDLAGLAFFPLVLLGAWELALWVIGCWRGPRVRPLLVATVVTGTAFVLAKTTACGAAALGWAFALGQWLPRAIVAAFSGEAAPIAGPSQVVRDATDLLALPALLVAVYVGLRRRPPADGVG